MNKFLLPLVAGSAILASAASAQVFLSESFAADPAPIGTFSSVDLDGIGGSTLLDDGFPTIMLSTPNTAGVDTTFSFYFQADATLSRPGNRILFETTGSTSTGYGINYNVVEGSITTFARVGTAGDEAFTFDGTNATFVTGSFTRNGSGAAAGSVNGTVFLDFFQETVAGSGTYDLLIGSQSSTADTLLGDNFQTRRGGVDLLTLDGVSLTGGGAVIPEPSTYAALAGLLALGFVAYRRRK